MFGRKAYRTGDKSTNIGFLGILVFGEGYHNNHHAFPYSPLIGFDEGQYDIGYLFIKILVALGAASNLKPIPNEILRAKKRLPQQNAEFRSDL